MRALSGAAREPVRVYFTGGVSAVLLGWRESTIDVDLSFVPEADDILRALPAIKESFQINVELVWPPHFLPELAGWEERSLFIAREGELSFFHYDFYAQALAKIERGHVQDGADVQAMLKTGLVEPAKLRELFEQIVDRLYRYPAVDPPSLRRALEAALLPQ
jgi:hypothetical protein